MFLTTFNIFEKIRLKDLSDVEKYMQMQFCMANKMK